MKNRNIFKRYLLIIAILCGWSASCYADGGLSISQTRVIFEGNAKNAKVTMNNQSDRVYLINSKVLPTSDTSRPVTEKMPFMITPPLFRLEKDGQNTLLISRRDTSALPVDRESVFYLSFLAIPAVKKNTGADLENGETMTQVSLGIRTVIKLFYRPSDLSISAYAAPEKLNFKQQGDRLIVSNPTPYYQTFAQLKVNSHNIDVRKSGAMIAPYSSQNYSVSEPIKDIHWSVINDQGGISDTFQWIH